MVKAIVNTAFWVGNIDFPMPILISGRESRNQPTDTTPPRLVERRGSATAINSHMNVRSEISIGWVPKLAPWLLNCIFAHVRWLSSGWAVIFGTLSSDFQIMDRFATWCKISTA